MLCVLIGMPGSGKSTVGRQLARRLGLSFSDTDQVLESRLGCSIREFFEAQGESAFRDHEEQTLADCLAQGQGVISTGGGIVLRPGNRERLRAAPCVIYLRASPEDIYRRLRHDTSRPLLQVADPLRKLKELYADRDPLYREASGYVVETGRPTVAALVNVISMQLDLAMPNRLRSPSGEAPKL
ncbi:shikimate kinase [Curvibacter sp. RS43]|jgi:shikimate kinase|uniref:shikimate kinase n=1 Tax=Curvibacter microcysteis TaxID=3026419 RepID=UPI0023610D5C|nr:shikimate kinase [Curvibacter sp. RS43]MDD0810328.1 shikimate kinase [Curvibacter sp. RS43]